MKLQCKRCDHEWMNRLEELPKSCPACKSYKWNEPREDKEDKDD